MENREILKAELRIRQSGGNPLYLMRGETVHHVVRTADHADAARVASVIGARNIRTSLSSRGLFYVADV